MDYAFICWISVVVVNECDGGDLGLASDVSTELDDLLVKLSVGCVIVWLQFDTQLTVKELAYWYI
jgi:hypothetical protein